MSACWSSSSKARGLGYAATQHQSMQWHYEPDIRGIPGCRLVTPVMEFLRLWLARWLERMECALPPLPSRLVPFSGSPNPLFALCTLSNAVMSHVDEYVNPAHSTEPVRIPLMQSVAASATL